MRLLLHCNVGEDLQAGPQESASKSPILTLMYVGNGWQRSDIEDLGSVDTEGAMQTLWAMPTVYVKQPDLHTPWRHML